MSINVFRNASGMPHYLFDDGGADANIFRQRHERMTGIMADVGRKRLPVNLANIYFAVKRPNAALIIRHYQVIVVGEQVDGVEVLHQWQDTVRDGDHPVLAGSGLQAANHVAIFQVDILHPYAGQLAHAHAGVGLDQDDLDSILVHALP